MQRNILIILLTLFAAVAHLKASDSDAEKFPDMISAPLEANVL